jgi:uncharacterized membrane protein
VQASIEKSIQVEVPASTAYNQWTQFEEFPRFMQDVEEVKQLDERHLHWRAKIFGTEEEWDAEITEQIPDKRIAWCSTSGAKNAGVVTFHRLSDRESKVMLQLEYEPETLGEKVGDLLGAFDRRVERDLARFKEFIEAQGSETGAWRGEVKAKVD